MVFNIDYVCQQPEWKSSSLSSELCNVIRWCKFSRQTSLNSSKIDTPKHHPDWLHKRIAVINQSSIFLVIGVLQTNAENECNVKTAH